MPEDKGPVQGYAGRAQTWSKHLELRAWHARVSARNWLRQSLPGPIQSLGTHDAELCYKYTCLGSEGHKAETVLYTAGVGLEAECHRERRGRAARRGRPGGIRGPVTLGWWVCRRGSGPGLPGPRSWAPWPEVLGGVSGGTWAQLTSFRAWWEHEASSGGRRVERGWRGGPSGSPGSPARPAPPGRLTLRANSGRTKAARCTSEL